MPIVASAAATPECKRLTLSSLSLMMALLCADAIHSLLLQKAGRAELSDWLGGWWAVRQGARWLQDTTRPAKSTGSPSRHWLFLPPSTSLLGGITFLLVLKKLHFWYFNFFYDFYLFFVPIHCLIIGSLQPVTKYVCYSIIKIIVF